VVSRFSSCILRGDSAMTDGNTYAINKHLEAIEAYDLANPPDLYCSKCAETISGHYAQSVTMEVCPDCGGELDEA
jgi:hypothetical protein